MWLMLYQLTALQKRPRHGPCYEVTHALLLNANGRKVEKRGGRGEESVVTWCLPKDKLTELWPGAVPVGRPLVL